MLRKHTNGGHKKQKKILLAWPKTNTLMWHVMSGIYCRINVECLDVDKEISPYIFC